MKFEVKTENEKLSENFYAASIIFLMISILFIIGNITIQIGKVARNYEINYLCKLLIVEKSSFDFKKLSKLTNQTSKQKIWEICKEFVN